jgi:hypothetical protein
MKEGKKERKKETNKQTNKGKKERNAEPSMAKMNYRYAMS